MGSFRIARKTITRLGRGRVNTAGDPQPILEILERMRGKIAFDVGANVGNISLRLAKNFDRVFAFEPAYESFEELRRKTNARIEPFNLAVSDKNGFISLDIREEHMKKGQLVNPESNALEWGASKGRRLVPAFTLDTLTKTLPRPDFIKIDTEGHEAKIISAGRDFIKESRSIFLIEIHEKNNGEEIREMLVTTHSLQTIRHPGHSEGSSNWINHYFILANPS